MLIYPEISNAKRLYYQYLGFIKTQAIELKNINQFKIKEDLAKITIDDFERFLIPEKTVLGKRVEKLFSLYLTKNKYKILAKNIQIQLSKATLGELDFLIEDNKQCTHIELVYKYYLYVSEHGKNETDKWVGTNKNDCLTKKITKLKEKQFPLLFKPETKNTLQKINISKQNIKQKTCFKANLFVPISLLNTSIIYFNNACIKGWWLRKNEFTPKNYGTYKYFIPEKQDWLINPKYCKIWFSFNEICLQINKQLTQQKSPLCWVKKGEKECKLFFIVWW
jgi:hypothetical protein